MTMTSEEKMMRNLKLTSDIQRAKYDPRKFGCPKNDGRNHKWNWDMRKLPWKATCELCREHFMGEK